MAQSGSVVALGAICRGFESSYPVRAKAYLVKLVNTTDLKSVPYKVTGSSPVVSIFHVYGKDF